MPFFSKVLLFFSVPAILFALLAVPSLKGEKAPQDGNAWLPLQSFEVETVAPLGWRTVDPLRTTTELADERWTMQWPDRKGIAGAVFLARDSAAQLLVFAGPKDELMPVIESCADYYRDSVMIERAPSSSAIGAGGLQFQVERARYLPGPLSGDDSTRLLAWTTKGDLAVLVNGGGKTALLTPGAVGTFLARLSVSGR